MFHCSLNNVFDGFFCFTKSPSKTDSTCGSQNPDFSWGCSPGSPSWAELFIQNEPPDAGRRATWATIRESARYCVIRDPVVLYKKLVDMWNLVSLSDVTYWEAYQILTCLCLLPPPPCFEEKMRLYLFEYIPDIIHVLVEEVFSVTGTSIAQTTGFISW